MIKQIDKRDEEILTKLYQIWYASVLATHTFLSKEEIEAIAPYVPQAIKEVETLLVMTQYDQLIGFLGMNKTFIEMLFIDPIYRNKGYGKQLIQYAIKHKHAQEVSVNEQNPNAIGFYENMGFMTYRRSEMDEQGNPYPILYMKRK